MLNKEALASGRNQGAPSIAAFAPRAVKAPVPRARASKAATDREANLVFFCIVLALVTAALPAYAIGPVPIDWLSRVVTALVAIVVVTKNGSVGAPELRPLGLFVLWSLVVTAATSLLDDYTMYAPGGMTTSYGFFVSLRLLNLVGSLGLVYLVILTAKQGNAERLVTFIIRLGIVASVFAIYVYVAQTAGLPEPPRTRIGTGGGEQATHFTYAFHRAMGSFREPSHLAEWLLLPLFLSLTQGKGLFRLSTLLMTLAMLLTGSFAGIAAMVIGLAIAISSTGFLSKAGWRLISPIVAPGLLGLFGFNILVVANVSAGGKSQTDLISTLMDRVEEMVSAGGVSGTNRADIFNAIQWDPFPFLGYGYGNSALMLTSWYGQSNNVVSFHSLYVHILFSAGIIALLFFVGQLIYVVVRLVMQGARNRYSPVLLGVIVAYASCNALLFDEISSQFALSLGLGIALIRGDLTGSVSALRPHLSKSRPRNHQGAPVAASFRS